MEATTTFEVKLAIDEQRIAHLLCCAFEGGSNYWCRIKGYDEPTELRPIIDRRAAKPKIYEHLDYPLLPRGAVIVEDLEAALECPRCKGEGSIEKNSATGEETGAGGGGTYEDCPNRCDDGSVFKTYRLDREAIAKGLQIFAEKYPPHFSDWQREDDDATTGDVFLQCCLFGEIVYG